MEEHPKPDPVEPAGDQDPEAEREHDEAVERDVEPDVEPDAAPDAESDDVARERDEYLELAQRTQADFENYRKRTAQQAAQAGERAKAGLLRELLPVVDNLERALDSANDGEQHLAEGVRLVHSELLGLLERNGIVSFDPRGESFDPTFHEAISTRSDDGTDSGLVLDTVEKGYKLNGTVLRPARVVVSE